MLVLSRKSGQCVNIGDRITLRVLSVQGNRVRLGISAPEDCRILRGELDDWTHQTIDLEHLETVGAG